MTSAAFMVNALFPELKLLSLRSEFCACFELKARWRCFLLRTILLTVLAECNFFSIMSTDMPLNNRELFEKFKEARFEWNSTLHNLVLARRRATQEDVTEDQLSAFDKFAKNFSKAVDYRWQRSDRSFLKLSKKFSLSEALKEVFPL